ncbi:MAG TPA: tRNA (adenosine(37)-N6)-dimethylallyltransferase MiaA [Terriglobales bacterium]|nr:tRNA (adenosine(37)-N6)-dimethylallyltransferase MiaA [Terriglobales bacterium]
MPKLHREPLVVVVLGPTASGKTALALALARRFQGEIVNCDSVAMYREFEIGTAKPSAAERAEIPHHLVDCVDPLADVSAGEYARQARQILREIVLRETAQRKKEQRRRVPIVSGGTGLYLRALIEGLFAGPQRSDELRNKLRARVGERGTDYLHRILRRLDASAAKRIHANDVAKVIRAIEVCLSSRPPTRRASRLNMTELWQQGREPLRGFRILRLGLNPERDVLYARINQRAAKMFDEGLIAETEKLLAKYGEQARPLSSLGYKQAVQFLRGGLDREAALVAAQQAHRNYAKRQITWFRREPDVHWLGGFGDDPAIQADGIAMVEPQI